MFSYLHPAIYAGLSVVYGGQSFGFDKDLAGIVIAVFYLVLFAEGLWHRQK